MHLSHHKRLCQRIIITTAYKSIAYITFYDKQKKQNGIIKNHDFTVFDEIQTIVFQEPSEIQAALKSYLESGKTTIDNNEFSSECGLMLMGNIPLTKGKRPVSNLCFSSLPLDFRESALLDRFHCFIEGWRLPRINKSMIFKGWTINVEFFSEIMHSDSNIAEDKE